MFMLSKFTLDAQARLAVSMRFRCQILAQQLADQLRPVLFRFQTWNVCLLGESGEAMLQTSCQLLKVGLSERCKIFETRERRRENELPNVTS